MSEATTYTEEELDSLDSMERSWFLSLPPQRTIRQLMELYPVAKTAAMRATRARIKAIQKQVMDLSEVRDMWNHAINQMPMRQRPGYLDWLDGHIERLRSVLEEELSTYQKDLRFLARIGHEDDEPAPKGGVTDEQIARAKDTRIADLIKVRRDHKAHCLWHDDENPSMHVYGTRVHCFVCQNSGDAIDVYCLINNLDPVKDFTKAVKALAI